MEEKKGKPIDLLIHDTRAELIKVLNDSRLPLSVISMILRELLTDISFQENQAVAQQRIEFAKAIQEEQKKDANQPAKAVKKEG